MEKQDVDAAQLRVTLKQILHIASFLVIFGLTVAGFIVGATTWKNDIENRLDKIQLHQQYEDEKLLWIMENMQRRPGSSDYIPQKDPAPPKIDLNALPDIGNALPTAHDAGLPQSYQPR